MHSLCRKGVRQSFCPLPRTTPDWPGGGLGFAHWIHRPYGTRHKLPHYYYYYYYYYYDYFFYPKSPQRTARGHQSIIYVSCRMRDPTSTPHPLNPVGDPRGLDRLDRSGIP